jgi:hypothetical protein
MPGALAYHVITQVGTRVDCASNTDWIAQAASKHAQAQITHTLLLNTCLVPSREKAQTFGLP